ncbi:hypothetical protein F5887DRAFT_913779 [Amanita rubescens]|nr:hypothetical protein F5887DRAFT_913779 [Amanita rubescens]
MTSTPENSLGLQLEQLQIADTESTQPESQVAERPSDSKEKKKEKPYVNPERFRTGGSQHTLQSIKYIVFVQEKLSDEKLAERIERIKAQNEKIKQRRLDVEADEEAFRKAEQEERAKAAQTRQVQERVNHAREQNAKRKLDKIHGREWDSGKPAPSPGNKASSRENATIDAVTTAQPQSTVDSQWHRGGSRARPNRGMRGRGRGRGGASTFNDPSQNDGPSPGETQALVSAQHPPQTETSEGSDTTIH